MIGSRTAIRVLMCLFRRAVPHTVIGMGHGVTVPHCYDDLTRAPEHVVDLLLGMMRPYPEHPGGPQRATVDYVRGARAEARVYADRIWAEAAHAGATYGISMAKASAQAIKVTSSEMSELRGRVGEKLQPRPVDTPHAGQPPPAAADPPRGSGAEAHPVPSGTT
jgi:hypothetical protein